MSNFSSIENINNPTDDENSAIGLFAKKQKEIELKEIEKKAKQRAATVALSYVNLASFPISPEALILIPEEEARRLELICFYYDGQSFRLACLKPSDTANNKLEELQKKYFINGHLYLISRPSLLSALELYKTLPKIKAHNDGVEITSDNLIKFQAAISNYQALDEQINKANISDIITLMLAAALKTESSDIHVEAGELDVNIRFRIDGVLQPAAKIIKDKWNKIIARLKILAHVKINIAKSPQDGRFTIYLQSKKIDVRCSFLPTAYGESVVMRILDSTHVVLDLSKLGVRPEILPLLKKEIEKPNGLILATGPTGSGKTTSLYAIASHLNQPGTKIITLEDPIEYQLPNINQSQVDEKRGYTFSDGLRSILRQDPNIVMVGEIRDLETAEIAVQASLTGHLVLSTLHTNDAAGVIPRLLDMGVKPYFLVPSINAVIGQRLVRRLCPQCQTPHELSETESELVNKILAVISPKAKINIPTSRSGLYKAGPGCQNCHFTGYKGRSGIYEVFTMSDTIKQLTIDKAPSFKILQQAIEEGMITMLQDGVLKAIAGETSLEEVYRVAGNFDYVDALYNIVISQTIGRGLTIKSDVAKKAATLSRNLNLIAPAVQNLASSDLVSLIGACAINANAGDIHIEPEENAVKIRFRIDGVMHDVVSLPKTSYPPILSEVKILAGAPTNIQRASFDGRFSIYLAKQKVDCRLSIITGGFGETIVIRLLSSQGNSLDMENLGIRSTALTALQSAMKKTRGLIITTGPTGSGKTTTLYSVLNQLNKPDVKIITVEDPIEYHLPGIMQTQIDEAKGYTFAAAMRSLLRQNPNIMMIGEIRDEETAKIAIEASMTGHLVLSTIHANSAAGAISRFSGLGLDRQILASSLEFVIGQRLVRRLCPHCKKKSEIKETDKTLVLNELARINNPSVLKPAELIFYKPVGCEECSHIGYRGRVGLYEVIPVTSEIKKLMQAENIIDDDLEAAAIKEGAITMRQDGILKALAGETSLEEILKTTE